MNSLRIILHKTVSVSSECKSFYTNYCKTHKFSSIIWLFIQFSKHLLNFCRIWQKKGMLHQCVTKQESSGAFEVKYLSRFWYLLIYMCYGIVVFLSGFMSWTTTNESLTEKLKKKYLPYSEWLIKFSPQIFFCSVLNLSHQNT